MSSRWALCTFADRSQRTVPLINVTIYVPKLAAARTVGPLSRNQASSCGMSSTSSFCGSLHLAASACPAQGAVISWPPCRELLEDTKEAAHFMRDYM